MTRTLAAALGLLVLVLSPLQQGCARNPVSGRPQVVVLSQDAERRIGESESAKVAKAMGLVKDPELNAYLQEVGERLLEVTPKSKAVYSWQVVDRPEPNAFALPGGPTYVSRGLLVLMNSEDELAGVVGHEMGHVAARHSTRRITVGAPFAIAFGLPAALVGTISSTLGAIVGIPAALASGLVVAPYARHQEHEADDIGMSVAAKAGWRPEAIGETLATLEAEAVLRRGEARQATFFDTHPTTKDRVSRIQQQAASIEAVSRPPIVEGREGFYAKIDGLLVGDDPKDGVFDGTDFLHPELDLFLAFPEGWRTENHAKMVVAMPEGSEGRTFSMLQISAEGDDPLAGPTVDEVSKKWLDQIETLEINGLRAARLQALQRGVFYDLTWYAYDGLVYRVSGVSPADSQEQHQERFRQMAWSFRPLRDEDRPRIREKRLRIARARDGERVDALLERVDNAWEPEAVAIANGLTLDVPLAKGHLVKYVRAEPYRGSP